MRAVIGTVASSKPISLTKAASILSRFSSAGAGAPRDVAAYLHRASAAFEDLVGFHRQLRGEYCGVDAGEGEEEVKKTKKKIENPVPTREIEVNGVVEKKKKKMNSERERQEVVENGGDGDGKKKKKKKRKHSSAEERGEEDGSEVRERKKKRKKNVAGN